MNELVERSRFVEAALSYLGTPYHHCGMIKGVGVDCATFLVCAGRDAKLINDDIKVPDYSPQWHLHRGSQQYLDILLRVCAESEHPARPGDIAIWQFGRAFSHAAIVVKWPIIVHACIHDCVRTESVDDAVWLTQVGEPGPLAGKLRPMKLLSYWNKR